MFNNAFTKRDLAISGHDHVAIPANAQNCSGPNQALLRHEAVYDYISEAAAALGVGRLVRKQLPQHILQNPAVRVIQSFLGRINSD